MDYRAKIILCAMPFLLAAYVWFSLTSPILSTGQSQSGELEDKRRKEVDLKSKLLDFSRMQKERTTLTQEIDRLRGSVPRDPNVDLLMIDLEKMALASGMDVVSFEKPSSDRMKKLEAPSETASPKAAADKNKDKTKKGVAKADQPVETGLSKVVLSVDVVGSYENFIELMKKLEAYERVVGVNSVSISEPKKEGEKEKDKKAETAEKSEPYKMLNITMMITAYYLP